MHNMQRRILKLTLGIKLVVAAYVTLTTYNDLLRIRQEGQMAVTHATDARDIDNTHTSEVITEAVIREMLLCVTDNNNATFDRYSVYFKDGSVLTLSENPNDPQGYSQWSEFEPKLIGDIHTPEINEAPIAFDDFPLKEHVLKRVREAYKDYVIFCKQSNASTKEIQQGLLKDYAKSRH